jgi:predicted ester cyclase
MTTQDNVMALRQAIDAFNDPQRRERFLELYDPAVVAHGYPDGASDLEGVRRFYQTVWRVFPDASIEIDEVIAEEERLAVRYCLAGGQVASFFGAPPTEGRSRRPAMAVLHFSGGRVVEEWQTAGTLSTLTRLAAEAARPRHSAAAEAAALRWEEREGAA